MKYILVCFALLSITSCQQLDPKQKQAREELSQILDVHDEIMPKTMSISGRIEELRTHANDSTEEGRAYTHSIAELDSAFQGMNDWMKEFHDIYGDVLMGDQDLSEDQLSQLNNQKEKVEELRKLYDRSFKRSDSLLSLKRE